MLKFTNKQLMLTARVVVTFLIASVTSLIIWQELKNNKVSEHKISLEYQKMVFEQYRKENYELKVKLEQIQEKLNVINKDSTLYNQLNPDHDSNMNKRLLIIETNLSDLTENHNNLRRSLKPTDIEDILTIPRLQDEVKILGNNLKDLESDLMQRQSSFEASIRTESESADNSTDLILVVLIPLVINFLYTVWKDIKETHKKTEETHKKTETKLSVTDKDNN